MSNPRNIWIDGYEANVLQRVGSGQVAFELIKNIEALDKKNNYTILLASEPLSDLPKPRQNFQYKILKINKLKTFLAIPWAIFASSNKPDVIFSPTHYIPRFTKIKRVGMIFDLAPLHFPNMFNKKDLYKLTRWTRYSVKNATHIVTISHFSKKDIIKEYGVSKNKITVAYPGFNSQQFFSIQDQEKIKNILKKYNIDLPYILYAGTIQPRKNLVRLIEAFAKFALPTSSQSHLTSSLTLRALDGAPRSESPTNFKLVLAGKYSGLGRQAWMTQEILEAPKRFGIEDRVIFTNFVPNEDLAVLMNGAMAYILPSLWEGFGIPPLEAMACGTPVIVSSVSSLPEVVGEAGLLIDPYSVDQIEQAIRLISTDKKLRLRLKKKSLEQVKKFSWKKMAKEVIKVLENV